MSVGSDGVSVFVLIVVTRVAGVVVVMVVVVVFVVILMKGSMAVFLKQTSKLVLFFWIRICIMCYQGKSV